MKDADTPALLDTAPIVIVDYGVGNLGSIVNMLRRIGAPAIVSSHPGAIASAAKLILPGVGAFDAGMRQLLDSGLVDLLRRRVLEEGVPLLGLCLGMQLLTSGSEEGTLQGLGWIAGRTVRLRFEGALATLAIPHMGWNTIHVVRDSPLTRALPPDARFYFVHSFHVVCDRDEDVVATTQYGYDFPSIVCSGNIMATQFHPEKSHRFGMALLQQFAAVD